MKKTFTIVGLVAVLASFNPLAQAIPITGTIIVQGGTALTPIGSPLGTASGVAATTGTVLAGSDSFAGTAGAVVSFQAFTFTPATPPANALWTFTVGGLAYSFDLTAMTVKTYDPSFLDIVGTGWLSITGANSPYQQTEGTWTYQISSTDPNGVGGVFSYQSADTAIPVPDGGMTLMLLGSTLAGFCLLKRSLA